MRLKEIISLCTYFLQCYVKILAVKPLPCGLWMYDKSLSWCTADLWGLLSQISCLADCSGSEVLHQHIQSWLPVCEMPPLPPDTTLLVSVDSKCFWDRVSTLHGAWWRFTVRPDTPLSQSRSGEQRLWQHIFLPDDCMNWQIKCICCWHGIQSKLKADSPKCLSNCLSQSLTVPSECCQVNDIGRGPRMSTLPAEVSAAELTEMKGSQTEDENIKMFTEVAMLTSYKKSSFPKEGFGWVGKTAEIKWEFIDWTAWKNMALLRPPQLVTCPWAGQRSAVVFVHVAHIFSCMHFTAHKFTQTKQTFLPRQPQPCITSLCGEMVLLHHDRQGRKGGWVFPCPSASRAKQKPFILWELICSHSLLPTSGYNPFWWHHRYCWGRQGDVTMRSLWL